MVPLTCCVFCSCQDSLGISHVTEPTSTATQGVVFLFDRDIFYEIICFGMNDKDNEVRRSFYFLHIMIVGFTMCMFQLFADQNELSGNCFVHSSKSASIATSALAKSHQYRLYGPTSAAGTVH